MMFKIVKYVDRNVVMFKIVETYFDIVAVVIATLDASGSRSEIPGKF